MPTKKMPIKKKVEKAPLSKEKKAIAPKKAPVHKKIEKEETEATVAHQETIAAESEITENNTELTDGGEVMLDDDDSKLAKGKNERYFEAIGRRKRARARVRLFTSNPQSSAEAGNISVNDHGYKEYFPSIGLYSIIESPLKKLKSMNRFRATVKVEGGGSHAQAEAVRHGLSRALTLFDANFRKRLKRSGYLKRDPREKERKKYGLKKARRRPQWAKR